MWKKFGVKYCSQDFLRADFLRAIPFEKLVGGVSGSDHPAAIFFVFLGVPRGDIRKNLRPPHGNFHSASQTTPYPTISFSRGTLQWFVSLKLGSTPIKWGWAEKIDYPAIVGWSGLTPPRSDIGRFGRPPRSDIGTILGPPATFFFGVPDIPPLTFQME